MKTFLLAAACGGLLASAASVHADLTIVQKMDGMGQNMQSTAKFKGTKTRVDAGPNMSIIMDLKSGEMEQINDAQKTYLKVPMQITQAALDSVKKMQGDGVQYVVGPTGDAQCLASLPTSTASNIVQACFTNGTKPMDGTQFPYSYVLFHSVQMIADVCFAHFHAKGARKFGVLVENTTAGEAAVAACKLSLAKYKLEPTTIQVFALNSATVAPYISNLRKADTEVIVSFLGSTPSAALVLNAMAEQQWFPPITGHAGLMYEALFELVPKESLQNASAVIFKGLSWTPTESPGPRQLAFAKKMLTYPDVNSPYNVASGPYYDFIYLLKSVIEQEKSFDTQKVKAALDRVQGWQGVRCKLSFTPENHCGVTPDEIVLASVTSAKDPRSANSVFRERLA